MVLSLGPLYDSIVSKVQNGKWFRNVSIKTTAHWNASPAIGLGVLANSLDKDEIDFLENQPYEHSVFPLCW